MIVKMIAYQLTGPARFVKLHSTITPFFVWRAKHEAKLTAITGRFVPHRRWTTHNSTGSAT
jgi:hypothetical protein